MRYVVQWKLLKFNLSDLKCSSLVKFIIEELAKITY